MPLSSFHIHVQAAGTAAGSYRAVGAGHAVVGWSAPGHAKAEAAAIEVADHGRSASEAAPGTPEGNGASWSAGRMRDLAERHAVAAELTERLAEEVAR